MKALKMKSMGPARPTRPEAGSGAERLYYELFKHIYIKTVDGSEHRDCRIGHLCQFYGNVRGLPINYGVVWVAERYELPFLDVARIAYLIALGDRDGDVPLALVRVRRILKLDRHGKRQKWIV